LKEPPSSKYFLQFYCQIDTTGVIPKRDLLGNVIPDANETVNIPSSLFKLDTSSLIPSITAGEGTFEMTFFPQSSITQTTQTTQTKSYPFFWDGESGFNSTTVIYAVDRQHVPPTVMLCDKNGWVFKDFLLEGRNGSGYGFSSERKNALGDTQSHFGRIHLVKKELNRTTAEIAGKLAHNDGQYFLNESQIRSYAYSDSHSSFRNLGNYTSNYRIGSTTSNRTHVKDFLRVDEVTKIEVDISLLLLYEAFCKK